MTTVPTITESATEMAEYVNGNGYSVHTVIERGGMQIKITDHMNHTNIILDEDSRRRYFSEYYEMVTNGVPETIASQAAAKPIIENMES